jgi:predicted nucleic acid-binding protein
VRASAKVGHSHFAIEPTLLYLLSDDPAKADRAEGLLVGGGTVSAQVLNEFAAVARRKLAMPWPEVREVLATVRAVCAVEPVSEATHELGVAVAERYGFSVYDGLIVAAASLAGCGLLHTEDLQDGQTVQGVTVRNPFGPAVA